MSLEDFLSDIRDGAFDNDLKRIAEVVRRREQFNASFLFEDIEIGTVVQFIGTVRPKYLAWVIGTVTGKKNKNLVVTLDNPVGRFSHSIIVPPIFVRVLS